MCSCGHGSEVINPQRPCEIVLPPIDGPRDLLTLAPRRHNLALARLDENLGAAKIELTPDDLCMIDNAAAQIRIGGARYPEKLEQLTGRQPSETTGG
jgi:hypothetical protein